MRNSIILILLSYSATPARSQDTMRTISGYMLESSTGEPVLNGIISTLNGGVQTVSNRYGFYSLSLKAGQYLLETSAPGFNRDTISVDLRYKDISLDLQFTKPEQRLNQVHIVARRNLNEVKSTRISVMNLKTADIKNIPTIGGELDIIKVVQLLPGIQKGAEGQSGFQVRGGDPDQNLILLDEATVYNISHLFGFFSVFIPEAIEDMEIYKGGFPAEYGGRLSSILDLRMKDGNKKHFRGSGGIGILSSRLTLEGPIIKDKASFIVSARRTYIDRVLAAVKVPLPYYFYDMNAKLSWQVTKKDKLSYSFYYGNDVLTDNGINGGTDSSGNALDTKFGFQLGNMSNSLRWNHVFNPRLFCNTSIFQTRFRYYVNGQFGDNGIFIGSRINDIGVKSDFTWYKNQRNTIKYGISLINHTFKPNVISAKGLISEFLKNSAGKVVNTFETGVYIRNEATIRSGFKLNYGARISTCLTERKLYAGLEPRLAAMYETGKNSALKFGYARMKQYLHLVSSSSVSLPTDLWYPVTKNVKPQRSDQFTLGYQYAMPKPELLVSVEAYYKTMHNTTEYREGAVLLLNNNYENELLQGRGHAYGAEFLIKRDKGRLNGWVAYTLSWSNRIFPDLNQGKIFPAKYDRRHNISVVGNYRINTRWDLGLVWVYSSGARFTAQVGKYFMPKPGLNGIDVVPIYTSRNEVRMSPSHRLDLNLVRKGKIGRKFETEWVFSMYNFYNRAEPYRVRIVTDPQTLGLKYDQPGLFGALFSIAFNFKF